MNEVIKCLVERRSCKKYLPRQVDEVALQAVSYTHMTLPKLLRV